VWARAVVAVIYRNAPPLSYPMETLFVLTFAGMAVWLVGVWLLRHAEPDPESMTGDLILFLMGLPSLALPFVVEGLVGP
jgi:hypothetical protein